MMTNGVRWVVKRVQCQDEAGGRDGQGQMIRIVGNKKAAIQMVVSRSRRDHKWMLMVKALSK